MILFPDSAPSAALAYGLDQTVSLTLAGPNGVYTLYVSWPAGPVPATGWPVCYMLDGETFPVIREILRYQVGQGAPGLPAPRMLVAIGYAGASRRAQDYAPAHTRPDGTAAGGAVAFRRFVLDEVRARISARWPVDAARQTLMGHSLGGLFVLDTLFEAPDSFQTWVASSPSFWWQAGYLPAAAPSFVQHGPHPLASTRVLLSAAEHDQTLTPAELLLPACEREALLQTRIGRNMVDGNRALADRLATVSQLAVTFRLLPGETHRSAWPCAAAHAFRA